MAQAKAGPARAAGVFEALGEPVRRRILELLADGELPVGPLVVALRSLAPISQPAVSQHLRVLLDVGLVSVRAAGTRRLYALDQAGLDAARAWLAELADPLGPFAQPLDALATEVARGRRATRASRSDGASGSGGAGQGERPAAAGPPETLAASLAEPSGREQVKDRIAVLGQLRLAHPVHAGQRGQRRRRGDRDRPQCRVVEDHVGGHTLFLGGRAPRQGAQPLEYALLLR